MKKIYAPIGTIIERTLQARDLIPAFCDELETAMQRYRWQGMTDESTAFSEYRELIEESRAINCDTPEADYCLESLFDALGDFAPPYTYFGAHPGDGSDFGFWPHADAESLADAKESGYRVEISDHGNVSLYDANDIEIWAIV